MALAFAPTLTAASLEPAPCVSTKDSVIADGRLIDGNSICSCCAIVGCKMKDTFPLLCEARRCCVPIGTPDPDCCADDYSGGRGRMGSGLHDSSSLISVDSDGNVVVTRQYPPPPPPSPPAPPALPPAPSTQVFARATACGATLLYASDADTTKSTAKSGPMPLYFKSRGDVLRDSMSWPMVHTLPLAPPTVADGNLGDCQRRRRRGASPQWQHRLSVPR